MITRDEIQSEAVEAIVRERARGVKSTLMQMPTQTGKAQPLDSKILTPSGWTLMGDIRPGNLIVGSNGKWDFVRDVFPQGPKEVYRITFSDGSSAECCDDHLWKVRDRKLDVRRVGEEGMWKVYPTSFLRTTIVHTDGHWRWSIPMVEPIEFSGSDLPIDPYLMGLILGDGGLSSAEVGFSNPECEIQESVRRLLPAGVSMIAKGKDDDGLNYGLRSAFGSPNVLRRSLTHYGLMGKRSIEKHIPKDYLFARLPDRIALLQGLLDADGSVSRFTIEYSTSSPHLAEDFRFLVESLGGRVSMKTRIPKYTYRGERRDGHLSYRIIPAFPRSVSPFRLRRKADAYIPREKYQPHRAITSIESVGVKECRCISVSAGDSLYVTDHCILTHNTRTICKYIGRGILEWFGRFLVCAHMGELLDQFAAELTALGISFRVEQSEQRALDWMRCDPTVRVCLGSKDTLQNRGKSRRLDSWPKDFFTDVIEDECHLSVAKSWVNVHDHFASAFRVGMTATIDRLDGVPLCKVFESTAYTYRIDEAIGNGHRVPFRVIPLGMDLDIKGIKANAMGEFNPAQLEARMGPQLEKLANVVRMRFEDLRDNYGMEKAIVFLPSVSLSRAFAAFLTGVGVRSDAVWGDDPARSIKIKAHRRGEFPVLVNKKLLGMGYNDPAIGGVFDFDPTNSRAWLDQKAGRCGATKEGKRFGFLVYPNWHADPDLFGPTDIFAGDADAEVKKAARKLARLSKDFDPQALIEKAKEVVARDRERQRKAKVEKRDVRHRYRMFDPIGVRNASGIQPTQDLYCGPQDPALVQRLRDMGMESVRGLSNDAMKAMDKLWTDRKACGMSSLKQFLLLVHKLHYDPARVLDMTCSEAGVVIGKLRSGSGYRAR